MSFVHSHGVDLYYEVHGQGPAVVFAHGAGSNAATWWQQLPAFSQHYTCVLFDARCFGRSTPSDARHFWPRFFVDDVLAILDAEHIERAAFIGQSMGGMAGLRLALVEPGRVTRLVLADSPLALDHPALMADVRGHLARAADVQNEERALGPAFQREQPGLVELYRQIRLFNPSSFARGQNDLTSALMKQRFFAPDYLIDADAVTRLRCPVLYIGGEADPVAKPGVMRELAALTPLGSHVVVPRAGHSAYFEEPEAFNSAVLEFLAA